MYDEFTYLITTDNFDAIVNEHEYITEYVLYPQKKYTLWTYDKRQGILYSTSTVQYEYE